MEEMIDPKEIYDQEKVQKAISVIIDECQKLEVNLFELYKACDYIGKSTLALIEARVKADEEPA